jgi:hypothetical protein
MFAHVVRNVYLCSVFQQKFTKKLKHTTTNKQMKKILFLLVFMLLPLAASAIGWVIDGINYELNRKTKTAQVIALTGREGYTGDIIIPSSVNFNGEYSVTRIANNAFSNCPELTSVTIPNTVTSIAQIRGRFSDLL